MKKFFLITGLFLFISLTVCGQKNDDFPSFEKLYSSLAVHFKYPEELKDHCIPTITLMKLQFDNDGEILDIVFSDSAHPLFVDYMQKIRDDLDFKSIYTDLKNKGYTSKTVLIPFQIDSEKIGECISTISSADLKKVYLFSGKPSSGEYFLYPSIYFRIVVGRTNI
ncbi:hypothetical protein [Sphingobacterium sp.]|uniref:hypothetical protein n=1 Tax=Sphingobacterium sp. TaxID=341027 RepID=UPI0031DE3D6F